MVREDYSENGDADEFYRAVTPVSVNEAEANDRVPVLDAEIRKSQQLQLKKLFLWVKNIYHISQVRSLR
jgi:hypothetical protein